MDDEVEFLPADKHQKFLQNDSIILGLCGEACPNYPKWFVISLQYLKKEVSDEVDFLHADKHENFLPIDTMIFDSDGQAFPKFPK